MLVFFEHWYQSRYGDVPDLVIYAKFHNQAAFMSLSSSFLFFLRWNI